MDWLVHPQADLLYIQIGCDYTLPPEVMVIYVDTLHVFDGFSGYWLSSQRKWLCLYMYDWMITAYCMVTQPHHYI